MNERRNFNGLFAVLLLVALAIVSAGYIVGHTTYLTPYKTVTDGQVQNYIPGNQANGNISFLQLKGDSSIYFTSVTGLTPKFSANSLTKTSRVALTVLPDSIGNVDIKASKRVELKGLAFRVIALVVTTGSKTVNYATQQYTKNPGGIVHDQLAMGNQITLAGVGTLALFVVLLGMFGRSVVISDTFGLPLPSFPELPFGLVVGVFFIAFSFPIGVSKLGEATGWQIVSDVGTTARSVDATLVGASSYQQILSFDNLWSKFLIIVAIYLAVLALVSLRHLRPDLFGLGLLFLVIGAAWLHLLSWLIAVLIWLLTEVLALLGWIASILAPIVGFLATLLGNLFGFILTHGCWAVIVALLLIGVIYLVIKYREELLEFLLEMLRPLVYFVLGLGAIALLIFLLVKLYEHFRPFFDSLFALLGRIFAVVFRFLVYALIGYLIGGILFGLGALLLDQFRGAWNSGSGRRGVILGSLAIGISIALILVESDLYGAVTYFPPAVAAFISANLHEGSPIFDLLIALVVVIISTLGLLRNLRKLRDEPKLEEFQTGVTMTLIALPLAGAAIAFSVSHIEASN